MFIKGKTLLITLTLLIVLTLLLALRISKPPSKTPFSSTSPAILSGLQVTSLSPDKLTALTPGQKQTFKLTFSKPVDFGQIGTEVKFKDFASDQVSALEYTQSITNQGLTLEITPALPIKPLGEYQIKVISTKENAVIYTASYLTDQPKPTPIASNNPTLVPFLPFETKSYKLSFDSAQNTYIFNFKYDETSSLDLASQYQNAENEATKFIESKGVNINSIVIDWRYH